MRKPAQLKKLIGAKTEISLPESLPPPTGGWNARDNLAVMDIKDAVTMINWFPETTDVVVRKGWADHATGIGAQVNSLMSYANPSGTNTLFGAAGSAIYNVTSAGAVGAAVVSSLSNSKFQYVNFVNSSGTAYLCCFNGADAPRYWDGSTWTAVTDISTPAITGVTATGLINVSVHKRRMWLTEVNTLNAWYLPVDSVGGAANKISLAGIAYKGGYLMATESWTIDAGEGADDYWVGITSEGQAVVYRGTDPSSASTWSLTGVWNIGQPIGRRCFLKYAGDVLVICVDGVFPLSQALVSSQTNAKVAITDKINKAMTDASVSYRAFHGWQLIHYPQGNMIILNVPVTETGLQEQYVMNTITGSWCKFQNMYANCWVIHNKVPYFGTDGEVAKFGTALTDNSNDIQTNLKQAFNYFGTKGRIKKIKMVRPNFVLDGAPSVYIGMNFDYDDTDTTSPATISPTTYGIWDSSLWDTGVWGGFYYSTNWESINGEGTSCALRIKSSTSGTELRLESTDCLFEVGGIIG